MFGWPILALLIALGAGLLLGRAITFSGDWIALLAKSALFTAVYTGILLLTERKEYLRNAQIIWNLLRHRKETME